jgi:ketosteroid isomerase-like protein
MNKMKKLILITGFAITAMAAYSKNAKVSTVADKPFKNNLKYYSIVNAPSNMPEDSSSLRVVTSFFDKFKKGATPDELVACFDEQAEYFIPGDTKNVPWIGKRVGRAAIKESFRLLKANIQPERLIFTDILAKGDRVVILGYLESRMKRNNKQMKSEFSINIVVKNGLLTSYHLLEDSFEVSNKVRP